MKRFLLAFATVPTLLVGTLLPVNFAQAENSSPLVTCVNLSTKTERISRTGKCRTTQEAQANWHVLSTDSRLPEKGKSKLISICSNKTTSPVTYQIIRAKCASHQIRTDYFRSNLLNASPTITKAVATGYDSAQVSLANDSNANPDAPVAYYTITSDKGQSKNIYTWGETNLTIENLAELTTYSFTVTVTTADGTSSISASSNSVKTEKYVAPPAQTSSSAQTISAPVAQVSLLSSDTASVTIPAGATSVAVSAPTLGNPSLSFGSQSAAISATISSAANPAGGSSTPFSVSGSTKIVDIAVSGLSGSATVCLDASPTAKLWHYIGGAWVDITSSRTSTQVCGLTSSFSPFTGEDQLPAPAFTLSTSPLSGNKDSAITPITATKTAHTQTVTYSVLPALPSGLSINTSTGTISGTPTATASATDFVITATNAAAGTATQTLNMAINAAIPCSSGGPCALGAVGPSGGIVFYVNAGGFNCGPSWTSTGSPTGTQCHYLEVAPKNWFGSLPDPARPGRVNSTATDIASIPNNYTNGTGHQTRTANTASFDYLDVSQLGAGLLYSNLINSTDAGATAARLARAYVPIVGVTDYYLPTLTELNLLCQWSKGTTQVVDTKCGSGSVSIESGLGGSGTTSTYWSSSDKFNHSNGPMTAWVLVMDLVNASFAPSPDDGSFGPYSSEVWRVRPIRAF